MRKFYFTIFLLFVCSNLTAKSMHLLLLGDDQDLLIGLGVEKNLYNVEHSFSKIAPLISCTPKISKFTTSSKTLTRGNIINWIKSLQISKGDIIIVYYAGHGHRRKETISQFPAGDILNEKISDDYVDFGKLIKRIIYKRADFNLILLDCCNIFFDKDIFTQQFDIQPRIPFNVETVTFNDNKPLLQKLFELKGFVIASGCSPHEGSWYTYSRKEYDHPQINKQLANIFRSPSCGGVFSRAFLSNLSSCNNIQTPQTDWVSVFDKTIRLSVEETKKSCYPTFAELPHNFQTPQFKIILNERKRSTRFYKSAIFNPKETVFLNNSGKIDEQYSNPNTNIHICGDLDISSIILTPNLTRNSDPTILTQYTSSN